MVEDILGTTVNDSICALSCSPFSQDSPHSAAPGLWQWGLRDNARSWKDESIHSPCIPAGCCAGVGYPEFLGWHGKRMLMCTWRHQGWDGAPLNPTSSEQWERERQKTPPVKGDFMPHPLSVSVLTNYKQCYHAGPAELSSTQPWKI